MAETEIDEYKLDTNQGKKHQTLRVSLINEELVSLVITEINNTKEKYYNLIRLEQFRIACEAFDGTKTIKEALNLIKETIEGGRILLSVDEENKNIDIKFNITLKEKNYPPFVIGLPIGLPEEEEEEVKSDANIKENENDIEVLPTKFDYQGDIAAENKYGQSTKNTTEYSNTIIKAQMKEPNLILEYIEPILQVHYPDGTTKSTPLPPRLQTADGKKPNINPEYLKSLHEQMARSFNQSISEYEKENTRSNSVSNKKISSSNYSRQTASSFGNNNNKLRQANSHNINIENNKRMNVTLNNMNICNNSNNLNSVRSAIKTKPHITFNNSLSNIHSTRTSFNLYDGNERGTDTNVKNKKKAPMDNYMNYKQNQIIKGNSDYSTSSVPNKPLVIPSYYGSIPNPTIKNSINIPKNSISNKNSKYMNLNQSAQIKFIKEIPRFINQNQSPNISYNTYDKGLNKSSSFPSMATMDKFNHNFYQNQSQTQFNFPQNQNLTYIQNQINNVNLRYKFEQPNPNNNLNQSIPILYQNNKIGFNSILQDFSINAFQNQNHNQNNILARHKSSQAPIVSQSYIAQMKNNNNNFEEQKRIFQLKNMHVQKRIQEQKKMGMMQQKPKANNNINKQVVKNRPPINQSQMIRNQQPQQINNSQQKNFQPIEKTRNSQKEIQPPLKQSYSQHLVIQKSPLKNEITQQQIALAQMASLQNLQNPKNFKHQAVQLNQKYLDSEGNEETQSQFEREEDEAQIREYQQKIKRPDLPKTQLEQEQYEINESNEAQVFENLYCTEEGLIIFRNGLLRGIIHKFAEITDVVSKIQIMVTAGVKFNLLYRASDQGDKAKIFHEKCDKHQMTLVLVETTKGRRFGGFTTKTWDGNCLKKIDNDAFVFCLDNNKIYDIRKNEYAIGGYPKFGPVFFGCQIRIYDEFFKKGGTTCQRGLNYKTKKDYELNNGEQNYIVKEIEVYDIEVIKMS